MLHKILGFLARQQLTLRGNGQDKVSNFGQWMKLHGMNNPQVVDWMQKNIQNALFHSIMRLLKQRANCDICKMGR